MYQKISLESAPSIFNPNYNYEQLPDGRFRATAIEDSDGIDNLRLVFPSSVPLDGKGKPFVPGCDCATLMPYHKIYEKLQLSANHVFEVIIDTGYYRKNENDAHEFEFAAPDVNVKNEDVMFRIEWEGRFAPPMKGLDCSFARQFNAKYFARSEPDRDALKAGLNTFGYDLWIIPRHPVLAEALREITKIIRQRIVAGDVFAATAELTAPYYRNHMEHTLYPCIQSVNPHIIANFGADCAEVFDDSANNTRIGRFYYTLNDAQSFALLAEKRRCRIANGDPD